MNRVTPMTAVLVLTLSSGAVHDSQETLSVKHLESPRYSSVARAANVTGSVSLNVTVDADGAVAKADPVSGPPLLSGGAVENIRSWTFEKPLHTPFLLRVVYEYRLEGEPTSEVVTASSFDLPDHVRVVAHPMLVETIESKRAR